MKHEHDLEERNDGSEKLKAEFRCILQEPFFGPAAGVSVDSMRVSVPSGENPVSGGALGRLLSHARSAPL